MVDQPPRRQVRIKIGAPTAPPEPKTEYIYHWDRIIGALAALLVVVGLAGYGIYAWLAPDTSPRGVEEVGGQDGTLRADVRTPSDTREEPVAPPEAAQAGRSIASQDLAAVTEPRSADAPVPFDPPVTAVPPQAAVEAAEAGPGAPVAAASAPSVIGRVVAQDPGRDAVPTALEARSPGEGGQTDASGEQVPPRSEDDADAPDREALSSDGPRASAGPAESPDQSAITAGEPAPGAEAGRTAASPLPVEREGQPPSAGDAPPGSIAADAADTLATAADAQSDAAEPAPPGALRAAGAGDQGHLPADDAPLEATAAETLDASAEEAEPAAETASAQPPPVTETAAEEGGGGLIRATNRSVSSPAVKRFLLAQSVVGNEPRGDVGDIRVNAGGYAPISSFSEVIGLQGEVLHYRWLHEGKEVLRIRVPVGAERWRSHSTKRLYRHLKGSWRAELRDSGGALLAAIDFVF